MKIVYVSLLCSLLSATQVQAGAYQDGYKEGEKKASRIWKKDYDKDCYDIFDYSIHVRDELIRGEYKDQNGQNWRDESFNRGGRDGVNAEVVDNQKECLDPGYCDELGNTAAELIAADFCKTGSTLKDSNQNPVVMCRKSARRTCEGTMYKTIETTFKIAGSCKGIDDDMDNLSTSELLDLQDECKDQVDQMIDWDEFKDSKSKNGKKSKGKGKSKKKSKKSKKGKNRVLH